MIYITRHGQTDWNILKKVMGRIDQPLNENGRRQASLISESMLDEKLDLIICSPLLRARQTAQIINQKKNAKIVYDDRIIERDFGEFEGLTIDEFDFANWWDYYKNLEHDKAESITEFFNRIYSFLDEIVEKFCDKNVLIVTHGGGVSIPISCYFNGEIPHGFLIDRGYNLDNCEVRKFNNYSKVKKLYHK